MLQLEQKVLLAKTVSVESVMGPVPASAGLEWLKACLSNRALASAAVEYSAQVDC